MNQDELHLLNNTQDSLYSEYLKSLDDSNLINHIHSLRQKQEEVQGESTPKLDSTILSSTTSSDPFNDGLDEQLISITKHESDTESDFSKESPKDEETVGRMHSFDDYKTYFEAKILKQQKKDEEYIKWDQKRREKQGLNDGKKPAQIFQGCSMFVNGHTNPSINQLHRMIILHGGKFVNFLVNKSVATHIICDRLTPKKSIEFKNYKIAKAQWVVDCVEKQELLDWKDYRLISEVAYDQTRLDFKKANEEEEEEKEEVSEVEDEGESFLEKSQKREQEQEGEVLEESLPVFNEPPPNSGKGVHQVNNKYILDARHPDFLPSFFANSRLHHLSVWKADLRLKFLRKIIKENLHKSSSQIQHQHKQQQLKSELPNKYIMHIDFDCFFATASCLKYPNLNINKDPIAVAHGGKSSDVASCNYIARSYGIRNGMWLKNAKQLCPNLVILDYEFENYEKFSNEFYNYLISDKLYFDTIFPVSIDECLIDITSYIETNGVEKIKELAEMIRSHVFKLTKCTVSIGVSSNVLLAKLALKKAKPDGFYYLHQNIKQFLQDVPIKNLPGFGRGIIEKLQIENTNPKVSDIRKFSQHKLIRMLGHRTGMKLFEFSKGIDHSSIETDLNNPEAMLGRKSISVDVNFGIRFDSVDELDDFLIRLSKELYNRLINAGICGSQLTLRLAKRAPNASYETAKFLGLGDCEFVNKTSRLGVETNDWGIIGNEIKTLYRMLNIPPKELRGISITMTKLKDAEQVTKNRQMKLPFGKIKKIEPPRDINQYKKTTSPEKPPSEFETPQTSPTKLPRAISPMKVTPSKVQSRVDNKLVFSKTQIENRKKQKSSDDDINSIDWEVFQSLPEDIKKELEGELIRRGLIPAPAKPIKQNQKVYLQQLIPTQINKPPKYVRIIESPKKSPKKSKSSPVKLKKENGPEYEDSQSYDTSIINELPSSIKETVLKEIEYKKKIKNMDVKSMKEKLTKKIEERKINIVVNEDWIDNQQKVNNLNFLGNDVLLSDMIGQLQNWIKNSLDQQGPHIDDVNYFVNFLSTLLENDDLNKVIILIKEIKTNLSYFESLGTDEFIKDGILDWYNQLNSQILPVVNHYCQSRNIIYEL
ncbi:unnamed protein product [Candida verbasci]|uniref:DNA repair protein REV1 n=1 Tax=Candida verbasci TaxID=1227364 RepID=A0A9W4TYY6_9ASCO|nr:unnamed protein product [Candida verbasci]